MIRLDHLSELDAFGLALAGAIALHAALILGVSFDIHRGQSHPPDRTIDVTMVKAQTKSDKVEDPQFLAQSSQQGGGEKDLKQQASSQPSPPAMQPRREAARETQRSGSPRPEPRTTPNLITSQQATRRVQSRPSRPQIEAPARPDVAQLLASTEQEINQLAAELDRRNRYASKLDRHKAINASTQEYKYAAYLQAWRKKIERIGNLNYPDEAKRKKLFGNLMLHVAVRADGSIDDIRLVRSSGHKVLDDAAIRIVRLAAPFAPFPADIRKEVDVLDITRTWQFLSGNQLFTGN